MNIKEMAQVIIPINEIWFYSEKEKPSGAFSNFYPCKIIIDDIEYPNSEAYYQSLKFRGKNASDVDLRYSEIIRSQTTGNKAAILARQSKPQLTYQWGRDLWVIIQEYQELGATIRKDWDEIKDNVMRRVVYQKFSQNEKLRSLLLSTGDKLIYEHTNRDSYWADGHPRDNPNVHGDGKNMLGIILEEVRYILGGQLSSRFKSMNTFEYSNWIIPGILLMSGCPREENFIEMKKGGFQYFISLMTSDEESPIRYRGEDFEDPKEDFCMLSDDVILARYEIPDRKITEDEKAISISHVALQGIGRGNPVVLHCFGGKGRTGTIISIIIGLLYGLNGDESMEIAERLFLTHRPNKGKKLAGTKGTPKGLKRNIPQTQVQINQVKRILNNLSMRTYEYFDLILII